MPKIEPEPQVAPKCWLGSEMFDVSNPERAGTHWRCSQHCPCGGHVTYVFVNGQRISTGRFRELYGYAPVSESAIRAKQVSDKQFATFQRNCPHPAWDFSHAIRSEAFEKCLRCGKKRRI